MTGALALFLVAIGAAGTSTSTPPLDCGAVHARCPRGVDGIEPAEKLGCEFYREALRWQCRADSKEAEAAAERDRADDLAKRLLERPPPPAPGWSTFELILVAGSGAGAAGLASFVAIDSPRDRVLFVTGSGLVGATLAVLAVLLVEKN